MSNYYEHTPQGKADTHNSYMWPVWPTLGWGTGLTFHFSGAFVFPCSNSVEREYEKLIRDKR
ncbi:MAG TPA: 2TM domain-containing protein [Flavisolibacter sp.]|nr:2TM domain-containing protein [Flavisolibacter sp.]